MGNRNEGKRREDWQGGEAPLLWNLVLTTDHSCISHYVSFCLYTGQVIHVRACVHCEMDLLSRNVHTLSSQLILAVQPLWMLLSGTSFEVYIFTLVIWQSSLPSCLTVYLSRRCDQLPLTLFTWVCWHVVLLVLVEHTHWFLVMVQQSSILGHSTLNNF